MLLASAMAAMVPETSLSYLPDDILQTIFGIVEKDTARSLYPKKVVDVKQLSMTTPPHDNLRIFTFELTFSTGEKEVITQETYEANYKRGWWNNEVDMFDLNDIQRYRDVFEDPWMEAWRYSADYRVSQKRGDGAVVYVANRSGGELYYDCFETFESIPKDHPDSLLEYQEKYSRFVDTMYNGSLDEADYPVPEGRCKHEYYLETALKWYAHGVPPNSV